MTDQLIRKRKTAVNMSHAEFLLSDRPEQNAFSLKDTLTNDPVLFRIDIHRLIRRGFKYTDAFPDACIFRHTLTPCDQKASCFQIIRRKFLTV